LQSHVSKRCNSRYPPHPSPLTGRNRYYDTFFKNRKELGAVPLLRDMPGAGASRVDHDEKPPGFLLSTPCFIPLYRSMTKVQKKVKEQAKEKEG
jgi:hypothetical protein